MYTHIYPHLLAKTCSSSFNRAHTYVNVNIVIYTHIPFSTCQDFTFSQKTIFMCSKSIIFSCVVNPHTHIHTYTYTYTRVYLPRLGIHSEEHCGTRHRGIQTIDVAGTCCVPRPLLPAKQKWTEEKKKNVNLIETTHDAVTNCVPCPLHSAKQKREKKEKGKCEIQKSLETTNDAGTGWRRLIGSPKLQIIFDKRATKYRSLLWKMTYKDKASYESSPPCTYCVLHPLYPVQKEICIYIYIYIKYENLLETTNDAGMCCVLHPLHSVRQ